MQLNGINRNEIIEHKKRVEKHKKAIESDVSNSNMLSKEVTTQEKTTKEAAKDSLTIKKNTINKKTIAKKARKAMKERQKLVTEKIMDDARKGIDIEKDVLEEEPEEPKTTITKEERAERFKKLHAMVQDMMKKRNE